MTIRSILVAVAFSFCVLGGCATQPPIAEAEFALAQSAIDQAEDVGASEVAGSELLEAQRKLDRARAIASDDSKQALRLIETARLHAEHAEVSARLNQSEEALAEINASLDTLDRELHDDR